MKPIHTLASAVLIASLTATPVLAAGGEVYTADVDFSFQGPFGAYDRAALQRGLQVYQGICAGCHGMKFVAFRTLTSDTGPGLTEDQVNAFIAEAGYEIEDEDGEFAPAKTYDYFPEVKSAGAPDMSLLAKARPGGAAHIYSILTGYTGEEKEVAGTILYGNKAYPGGWINMAPPLYGDDVEYMDGTEATLERSSKDVSEFLMWAAEPKMVERKQAGVRNMAFLILFAVLLYFSNKKLWKRVKHPK
jgi:ubiquinol-cytochrome c reductase cytochrome c1 subunit